MGRNKKLLMFLALNSLATSFAGTTGKTDVKYDKLYTNMIKNIETGKSNDSNYKLIQDVLDKRNKELKDLYLQGEYIVKPEYLEWQVFFSGFYNNQNGGGEASFKPYKSVQEGKFVDLGVSLNIKGLTKEIKDINVINNILPTIDVELLSFDAPNPLIAPDININTFSLPKLVVEPINISPKDFILKKGSLNLEGSATGFFKNRYTEVISQMDLISGEINMRIDSTQTGNYEMKNVIGSASKGETIDDPENNLPPGGNYTDSLPNMIGILGTQNNAIMRVGEAGNAPNLLTVSLEGDLSRSTGSTGLSIMRFFPHEYSGGGNYPTLDDLEANNWITASEKSNYSKYLDTTKGETTSNEGFHILENNGSLYLSGTDVNVLSMYGYFPLDVTEVFRNNGTIIGLNKASQEQGLVGGHSIFEFLWGKSGSTGQRSYVIDNTGTIEMRAPESVFLSTDDMVESYSLNESSYGNNTIGTSRYSIMNNGDLKLYGNKNIGFYTDYLGSISSGRTQDYIYESYYQDGSWYKVHSINNLECFALTLSSPMTILGDDSIGVSLKTVIDFKNSKFNLDLGTEDPRQTVTSATGVNGLENSGNAGTNDAAYTENSIGMYFNLSDNTHLYHKEVYDFKNPANNVNINTVSVYSPQITIEDYKINVGSFSRKSAAVVAQNTGDVVLGASNDSSTGHEINLLAGGEQNVGIFVSGTNAKVTADGMNMNIYGENQTGVNVESNAKFIHNKGTIMSSGAGNIGVVARQTGTAEMNAGAILDISSGSYGIYNENGAFTATNSIINVDGSDSLGIYAKNGSTNISGGTIAINNGSIGFYADSNSVINLNATNLKAKNNSLLFLNYYDGITKGSYNLTGITAAELESGAMAFYIKGQAPISYLTNIFTGTGILDMTLKNDSVLYNLSAEGTSYNLTTLDGMISNVSGAITPQISINSASGNFIPISMNKGTLVIDRNVNLNDQNDLYQKSNFTNLSVTLNNGNTLSGSQNGQIGVAQRNYSGTLGINEIKVLNNGIINMSNNNSTGIAVDYGNIINNNIIQVTGSSSVGIYSSNGTQTENNGEIVIGGTDTAGIYGVNYLDGTTPSSTLGYGDDSINISNNNKITSTGIDKVYGIYANNIAGASSAVTLGSGSNIDIRTSNGGVGIYADKTNVTGGGTLTVGTNGLGMYAKDSNVNLTGFNLNLYGDNALGFYLDGTTNFAGTGNIDVNGQNIALFNIKSSGSFTNNFNVTAAAGSSYAIGNVNNGTFYYNGTANLGSNGSLVNGSNTAVLLDTASNITSSGSSVVGAVLNGQYIGTTPSGFTVGIEGENRGNIALGDNSAGLYGTNGARLLNKGNISLGNSSLGLSSTGTGSTLRNEGSVTVGQSSEGMYGSESSDITNTGSIGSTALNGVGIYADGTSGMAVNNIGTIDMQGMDSYGIYTKGIGTKILTNSGTLRIGDSSNVSQPGVGIYSENGDTVTNTGTITSGTNSVGAYVKNGVINQYSIINTGINGTGIYANGTTVNLNTGSTLNVGDNNGVGVYAVNGSNVLNDGVTTVGNGSYGYVLKSGSNLTNNTSVTLGDNAVLVYGDSAGTIENSGQITMTGSNNVGIYAENGGTVLNSAAIIGNIGQANMGIYNANGSVNNTGNISVGDSIIIDPSDSSKNSYAIGIYGDNSVIENYGDMSVGANGIGIYTKGTSVNTKNYGDIISSSEGAIGIFAEHANVENYGDITLGGKSSVGIYGNKESNIVNHGVITLNNEDSTGVMLNINSTLDNQGTINVNGNNSSAVVLQGGSKITNTGTLNIAGGITGSTSISYGKSSYPIPSIVNAGVVRVSENFETKGIDISIKVDPATITAPTLSEDMGAAFVSDAVKFYAPTFNTTDPIGILSGFTTGTHAAVYKFEDVFNPLTEDHGGPDTGIVKVKSKSLTWSATPVLNANGNVDIWMEKIPYDEFTNGLWYEDFGKALDGKYVGSTGDAGKIFDKIDSIEEESDFRHTMASLSGNVYANMNQREETIAGVLGTSLNLLQDSTNNTKENVKINIIAGKGTLSENTDGVVGYDYETTGVLALREVERTYKHTLGYSLGYLHTNFAFEDGNNSEEDADTIQLGAHSKYRSNDWILRNDLTGRVSIHNIDRNMDWSNSGRSEMNGKYEAYSITSDNNLGKELSLGKNATVTPYGGIEATYITRPTFTESGLEKLEVKGNDAWSVKPKVGVELKASTNESKNGWKLKGALDLSYGYELADLNEREYAKLTAVENDYHKLSKPEENRGVLKTKAVVGAEIEDRYGIFLTGEYSVGEHNQDDYRAGVTLKAVF